MRPHQPGTVRRDPARLATTLRRNTAIAANVPESALHQDPRKPAGSQPRQGLDPPSVQQQISRTKPRPPTKPSQIRNYPNRAKHENPIDRHRSPAGSCLGGFRTPHGIRKPSPSQPKKIRAPNPETSHPRTARRRVPTHLRRLIPVARTLDSSVDCRAAGISLISRAAATPTLRAYQSALRAAGMKDERGRSKADVARRRSSLRRLLQVIPTSLDV